MKDYTRFSQTICLFIFIMLAGSCGEDGAPGPQGEEPTRASYSVWLSYMMAKEM